MNQQPDKFFREKLEGFQKTAPSPAWEKIEAGLDKKNNKGLLLKIAAGLLLLAAASFVIWTTLRSTDNTRAQTAERESQKVTAPQQKPVDTQITIADKENPQPEKKETQKTTARPKRKTKSPAVPVETPVLKEEETIAHLEPSATKETEAINPEEIKTGETVLSVEPVVAAENSNNTVEAVNIVYSAEEVNEKYLDKVALAKATSGQKKPSTFRKLLEKAYDLKNNQDPFGDLRQKKNEIFALNFKNEKRSQNK